MKAITILDPGSSYRLAMVEEPPPSPGADAVLIRVAAAGLNNADLLQARGKYPPPPGASSILGMEVSGTIAAVGDGVREWSVGDAVCALMPGGGYAEYALADAGSVLPVPGGIDLIEAAGLPEAAFTEFCAEHHAVQLTPEECARIDRERADSEGPADAAADRDRPLGPRGLPVGDDVRR